MVDRVGDGAAFATGYYEPEIRGSRTRAPGYDVPVYAMPPELVRAWPDDMPASERSGRGASRGHAVPPLTRGVVIGLPASAGKGDERVAVQFETDSKMLNLGTTIAQRDRDRRRRGRAR